MLLAIGNICMALVLPVVAANCVTDSKQWQSLNTQNYTLWTKMLAGWVIEFNGVSLKLQNNITNHSSQVYTKLKTS